MVNHSALETEAELVDDECPNTDYGNVTVSNLYQRFMFTGAHTQTHT